MKRMQLIRYILSSEASTVLKEARSRSKAFLRSKEYGRGR